MYQSADTGSLDREMALEETLDDGTYEVIDCPQSTPL